VDTKDEIIAIPTRAEHNRKVRRLWWICISVATTVFLGSGLSILILFKVGYTMQQVWAVFGIAFPICVASYGAAFFVPVMLTSTYRMWVAIEMSRKGLELGEKTADNLLLLEEKIERLEKFLKSAEDGSHPLVETFKEEMRLLREEIRGRVDGVGDALAQGEAEAEAILKASEAPKPD
jgi:hypothetical protein